MFLTKQHVKCGPAADRLGCRISIKDGLTALWWHSSQQTVTVRAFTAMTVYLCCFTATQTLSLWNSMTGSYIRETTSLTVFCCVFCLIASGLILMVKSNRFCNGRTSALFVLFVCWGLTSLLNISSYRDDAYL